MKKLILIMSLLFSASAMANFININKVGDCSKGLKVWTSKKRCGTDCIKIDTSYNCAYSKVVDETVPDYTKPNWGTRSKIEACSDESDCLAKSSAKNAEKPEDCIEGDERLSCTVNHCTAPRTSYYNKDYSEVWCNQILSYATKLTGRKIIQEDSVAKAQFETSRATKKAESDALAGQLKDMEFGKILYAKIQLLNKKKGLTKAQRRQFRNNKKDLANDILEGNLCQARADLISMSPDGTIIKNQAEIDSIISAIDAYKTCK